VACECRGHLRRESINGDKYAIENPDAVASSLRTHNESDQGPAHALIPKSATTGSIEQQLPTRRVDEVFRKGIDNDNAGRCLRDRTVYPTTSHCRIRRNEIERRKRKSPDNFSGLILLAVLSAALFSGGGKRDRTADLLHAMQALSQLSYTPLQNRNEILSAKLCFVNTL
jgi:hypothetical protein